MFRKILVTFLLILIPSISSALTVNGDLTVTGKSYVGSLSAGQSINCGMSVLGSTFSITQADGTALSSAKPCRIGINSNTAGRILEAKFSSVISFTFGASSDTDGNDWGITNTVNWSNAMPFFLGVIYDGGTPFFTISRGPIIESGSASTAICQKGDTDCDAQSDVMILSSGLTLSSWVSLPITQVGWFQMTYATSGGAWTAAVNSRTGFNSDFENIEWSMPPGQNGAASGKYLDDSSGVAPTFSNQSLTYWINKNGTCSDKIYLDSDGGIDGSGAVTLIVHSPYIHQGSSGAYFNGGGRIYFNGTNTQSVLASIGSTTSNIAFVRNTSSTADTGFLNSDFPNGYRAIIASASYKCFSN